ncbi:retrotransposon protein, putative, ty1-copia subclass, partial [Tanacetum coccineum]
YPKEMMGYSFYYTPKNKVIVARNAEFFENSLITQEAGGSLEDLELIHKKKKIRILLKTLAHIMIRIIKKLMNLKVISFTFVGPLGHDEADEYELGDLNEPANYKAALLDPESDKWLNTMNVEIKTVDRKWLFKKKTDMDGAVHTFKARLVAKGFTQTYGVDYEETFSPIHMVQPEDLGEAAYILGIKIYRDRSKRLIGLCQGAYIEKILKRYFMENSKRGTILMQEKLKLSKSQGASTPVEKQSMQNVPYASVVGSIMYAVRCELHWTIVKNILKYLRTTKDMFMVYGGDMKRELMASCYTDAGYLTDADDLKSQTGYVFILNGGVVDWKSTKQSIFATSSTDADYIAAFDASKEVVWIRKFIYGLGVVPTIEEPITMYYGNTGSIAIAKDHGVTKGARHFPAKVYYLREIIEMGDVRIKKVDADDNLTDPLQRL